MDLNQIPTGRDPDVIDVTVEPSAVTVALRPGEALLDGLRRHGYSHRHGCRRGGCGQCKIDVLAGEIDYDAVVSDDVLPAAERAAGTALSCRAIARSGPITIALRDETLRCFFPWAKGADTSRSPRTA
jgi:ferredoxin